MKKEIKNRKPIFGCAKGQIYSSPDFDEPLDDFKRQLPLVNPSGLSDSKSASTT
ncbi:DUF2281 domain-containing protein [Cryomorpha ignava]|uniref:DUF2281 domain-containing protein n=1 Tax=Cryomorpha ignava TaxID=101383 RepID=A0A7K3WVJ2_9FLAO|nr:DUF2281 domain-containing protein [Cryomorpha ignava]